MDRKTNGLGLLDVLVIIFIFVLMMSLALPVGRTLSSRQRSVICQDNLKKLGVALNEYYDDHDEYPVWDSIVDGNLISFIDGALKAGGYAKDEQIFLCPADNPHPSRVNRERADAWGFNPFEYSYGIGVPAVGGDFHEEEGHQILSADANWTWMANLSGYYLLYGPSGWDNPTWYSNTVAYRHENNAANFLLLDGHVESFKAAFVGFEQTAPDTTKIFFRQPGESIDVFY